MIIALFTAASAATLSLPPAALGQLNTVQTSVARYQQFDIAEREGWKKFGGDSPLMGEHWYLTPDKGGLDYQGRQPLDFSRPSNLMYTWINGKRVLTGVSFNVRLAPGEAVPDGFAGDADVWHVHDFRQAVEEATRERPLIRWLANGWMNSNWGSRGRLAMVHVWTGPIPNPDGPFAQQNRAIPYAKLGLPIAFASGASLEAAKGLNLATDSGCAETIDGGMWIANASGRTKRSLHQACQSAAEHVRPALASRDKARINSMAEHAFAMFDAAWNRELTPEQRRRIASISEHSSHAGKAMDHMESHGH